MSSRSSGGALGLGSQPSCSNSLRAQRNSVPALNVRPPRSRSLALLSRQEFCKGLGGSFCKVSDALGADLLDRGCSIPDPQLVRRIVSQVEFYLSDENLAKDAFLLKHVQKNKMGFVSIKLLTSFKKVKYLTRDWRLTLYALRFSELLEVNAEGTKVRRRVPVPESLLSIPPSKLLLAWELLPREQEALPPLQKSFLETITRMFGPFGAIASIRILRPGRKLPSDVRKYVSRFPELLSRCCALVEYESLEGARRALEELGPPGGGSIRVVQLGGKGSRKKPEAVEELVDGLGWKAQETAATFPRGIGDSPLGSGWQLDGASALPSLLLSKDPSELTWPSSDFKPSDWSDTIAGSLLTSDTSDTVTRSLLTSDTIARSLLTSDTSDTVTRSLLTSDTIAGSLLTSDLFPPFDTSVGTSGCFSPESPGRGCWSGAAAWAPWGSSSSGDPKPPPGTSPATTRVSELLGLCDGVLRLPHGPDGTGGFSSSIGRGELVLQH